MAQVHFEVGTSQLMSGNYPQALSELITAERLDPSNPLIQNNLGLAYSLRGNPPLAEVHLRKAIALRSNYTDAKNNLAQVLLDRGQYDLAITEATQVANDLTYAEPEKPQIIIGTAYFKKNQFSQALPYLQKAIEYQRDSCLAHSFYGRTLYELRNLKRASDALDQAVGFCQRLQFDEPHYYSALTYYQLGQRAKAEARFESLLKLYPQGKYIDKSKEMLETIRR